MRPYSWCYRWQQRDRSVRHGERTATNASLIIDREWRRVRSLQRGFGEGSPALICKSAASPVSYDNRSKKRGYRRNGVLEHFVWRTDDRTIDRFVLRQERTDFSRSEMFPGPLLDTEALHWGDLKRVLEAQQREFGSEAHRKLGEREEGAT